jgi:16S rRNA (uracil1498-N3)-methyltransferase
LFASSLDGDEIVIEGDDAHHAVRVLRLRPGERVTISDGEGGVADAVVTVAGPPLVARVEGRRRVERLPPRLCVAQGIPKTGKLEEIVQKLTEVGVDEIVPLRTARSVARLEGTRKIARLAAIAREASKQSRRAWLPRIGAPVLPGSLPHAGLTLVLHEAASIPMREVLPAGPPARITLVVGPEGGLTDDEVGAFASAGGHTVGLGETILRTETAALVACVVVLARYGRIG